MGDGGCGMWDVEDERGVAEWRGGKGRNLICDTTHSVYLRETLFAFLGGLRVRLWHLILRGFPSESG